VAWKVRELQQTYVNNMLKQGIIVPSSSVWTSPVLLTRKPEAPQKAGKVIDATEKAFLMS